MAGGKETPRQKMVGMMYLVLTALLALQVSNAVLEKFIFIDQSLQHAITIAGGSNERTFEGIKKKVEEQGNREFDVSVLKKAEQAQKLTVDITSYMDKLREELIQYTGGVDKKDGSYIGAKDYDKVMALMLGPEGQKNGKAYELEKKLNEYVDAMSKLDTGLNIEKIAKPATAYKEFRENEDQKNKDFAQLNFDQTPLVAALAVMSQIKSEAVRAETTVIERLAAKIGADQIKFDKIMAVVSPESKYIAAGTKYIATMFLAASASKVTPRMSKDGSPVKVENGIGQIEFTANAGQAEYDAAGNAKKSWNGSISISTPRGDTTLTVKTEYVVVKPVVKVESGAISALYLNCGNELNITIPALGTLYDPSFAGENAEVIKGAKKGLVTVVPSRGPAFITVSSTGYSEKLQFKVKAVPLPAVRIYSGGKEVNQKDGYPAPGPRSLQVKAEVTDESFKNNLPKDARFRVTEWVVTLARGKRAIGEQKFSGPEANISNLAAQAQSGDRLVIEVKEVKRMNFKDQTESVNGLGTQIFTIPIQ